MFDEEDDDYSYDDDNDDVCEVCDGDGGTYIESWEDGEQGDDYWHSCDECGGDN